MKSSIVILIGLLLIIITVLPFAMWDYDHQQNKPISIKQLELQLKERMNPCAEDSLSRAACSTDIFSVVITIPDDTD